MCSDVFFRRRGSARPFFIFAMQTKAFAQNGGLTRDSLVNIALPERKI